MARFDAATAECRVLTFREGLLAAVGHDLVLRVTRFTVDVDPVGRTLEAVLDPASLRVEHAVQDGRPAPAALGDRDRATIEQAIVEQVLEVARFPEIRFVATAARETVEGLDLDGTLTLHGVASPLTLHARRDGGAYAAQVVLHQPAFAITPYSALLGALRVKPDVHVQIRVPVP